MTAFGAVDLGSTQVKVGRVEPNGRFALIGRFPAPKPRHRGRRVETDANAWFDIAYRAVCCARREGISHLGLSVQRSSFLLWDARTGDPLTPLISWRDSRAAEWCRTNFGLNHQCARRTGLPLSAHYCGPKLAAMRASHPDLMARLDRGDALFGTLDSAVIWRWSNGRSYLIGPTIAARTLMMDPQTCSWSHRLTHGFGVSAAVLPEIWTDSAPLDVCGVHLESLLADQVAAFVALKRSENQCVVNAGTGTFVMRACDDPPPPGYLRSPYWDGDGLLRWCWEGTINAGSCVFSQLASVPVDGYRDFDSGGLGLVDEAAPGTPFLNRAPEPESRQVPIARKVAVGWRASVGYGFRLRQVIGDLEVSPGQPLVLGGGCARSREAVQSLSDLIARPVEVIVEPELSAAGAALTVARRHGHGPIDLGEAWVAKPRDPSDPWLPAYLNWRGRVGSGQSCRGS